MKALLADGSEQEPGEVARLSAADDEKVRVCHREVELNRWLAPDGPRDANAIALHRPTAGETRSGRQSAIPWCRFRRSGRIGAPALRTDQTGDGRERIAASTELVDDRLEGGAVLGRAAH